MTMGKRPRHNGDEQDAYSPFWRKTIAAFSRAGVVKKTKRRTHKRERREYKFKRYTLDNTYTDPTLPIAGEDYDDLIEG